MKTISDEQMAQTLKRVLPEISDADIQDLKDTEAAREHLKAEQGTLFFKVAGLFYKYDVEGIVFDEREHEYEGEVGTIIPRLAECQNAQDCSRVIHEEFAKWFAGRVRSVELYQELGAAVFEAWQ
jgi:hypothetical protein